MSLPKGTKLEAEIHWDNSAGNPRNPSSPPIPVAWGEQSKDEMGSLTLIAVPHDEADLNTVRRDYRKHTTDTARERIMKDPSMAAKVQALLAQ